MDEQQRCEIIRALARGKTPKKISAVEQVGQRDVTQIRERDRPRVEALQADLAPRAGQPIVASGIDVSVWQGEPDFQRAQQSGVQFVIARAGYGAGHADQQFARSAAECNRLGIPLGAYWFSYALSPEQAVQEARYCLEAVKAYRLEYPVFFDYEYASVEYAQHNGVTVTGELATQIVAAFCGELESARYYAAFYTNEDLAGRLFDMEALARYDLWYASYQSSLSRQGVGLWQHSSAGQVDGVAGDVDLDYSLRDYPAILRASGLNGLEPSGFPPDTPQWQIDGFEALVERGVVNTPDYWKARFDGAMTAGEIFGVMGKL